MARTKSRPVALSATDREWLVKRVRTGSFPAQQVRRARILIELDENDPDRVGPVPTQEVVAARAGVHVDTVVKTSRAYANRGGDVEETITRKKRLEPPVPAVVTGEVEARLIKLACSAPPHGQDLPGPGSVRRVRCTQGRLLAVVAEVAGEARRLG